MSDYIKAKPTAIMLDLLRKGAADPKGVMTLADHNDRTQDGILRRDMADVVHEEGATHSWLVINDRGRACVAKVDGTGAQQQEERAALEPVNRVDPEAFAHMVGTERTEVRRLHRDADGEWVTVELRYRVEGVKFKGASKANGMRRSVTVWGRCVGWPEGAPVPTYANSTWRDAYCAEIFYANPEEPVSAPQGAQEPPAAPVVPVEAAKPVEERRGRVLADIARVSTGTVTLGAGKAARVRPSYTVAAYGSSRDFADVDGTWVHVCGRCGGAGELSYNRHVFGGVCFGCNRTGLRSDLFTGSLAERDAFVMAWALRKERERVAAEKRADKIHAKRVAAWARWEGANGELVAWCRALVPDRVEEYPEHRQALADTREEVERTVFEGEVLERSGQFEEGFHAGRWWADFAHVERFEVFDSYGSRAANLIKDVRAGHEPLDGRGTALLSKIMRSAVQAQATSRYAGPVDAEVAVTGRVKRIKIVDGFNAWSPSRRMIVLEGTGKDAGITVVAYSGSAAAKGLEEGQEGVTVAGTVSRHKEYSGARETALVRPVVTV
ncbi:hypothetical protein AB0E08_07480 [Streptomyces sp. NPDC048281]|uniref:hypothetical protein n=1 Tax=Streptomyces sp. NPDC048281 TaxID=3154715 RepID=UPI00344A1A54